MNIMRLLIAHHEDHGADDDHEFHLWVSKFAAIIVQVHRPTGPGSSLEAVGPIVPED